jgi:AcrR family transcriptional regulator
MNETIEIAPAAEETDGRRRRSRDSRARVVAALLDLVREGDVAPSAERVAARASVGLRTVFRHFNDMDSLYREMSATIESELATALAAPLKGQDWGARLIDLIHKRATVYERIAPFRRASDVHRHKSQFLAARHAQIVASARGTLNGVLPSERREDFKAFETLDLLLSFEAWSRLRLEQGLNVQQARDVLERAARWVITDV